MSLASKFEEAQRAKAKAEEDKLRKEEEAAARAAAEAEGGRPRSPKGPFDLPDPEQESTGVCKTVHAWVLVMAGKRDVQESVFLEPTTVSDKASNHTCLRV